jgi:uncharacterized protein YndB with AHSA1/START domain
MTLEFELQVAARPETVFRFFTDPARFARWMGAGAEIAGHAGGSFRVPYPGGNVAAGTVVELDPPRRIVMTWGYERGEPNEPDAGRRDALLAACWAEAATFRDPTANVTGRSELAGHIANLARTMPGARLVRDGDVRVSHDAVLFDWRVEGPDGAVHGTGTNVGVLGSDGRFRELTGFWG